MMKYLPIFSIFGLKYVSSLDALFRQWLSHRYVIKDKIVTVHNKTWRRDLYKIGDNNPRIFNLGFRKRRVVLITA